MKPISTNPEIQEAFKLICQTGHPDQQERGFTRLKDMADAGDMEAAAIVGFSCQFEHIGHYDLDMCREYLDKAVEASNPKAQYYKGSMLLDGLAPYEKDPVMGKWLIQQAAEKGDEEAIQLLDNRFRDRTPEEIAKMFRKSAFSLMLWDIWDFIRSPFKRR